MKLLVAYLATPGGEDAVALAVTLARTVGASLDVTLVIPPGDPEAASDAGHLSAILDETADKWLAEAAGLLPDDVRAETHVAVNENPASGLIAEAERLGSSILVVGGSGGGITGRHSLGSVVNDILHSSPIPVVLAPSGFRHTGSARIREITAAIGPRPGAETILDTAVDLSARGDLPLRLLSLVSRDDLPRRASDDEALARAIELSQRTLDAAYTRLPGSIGVSSTVARGDSVEDAVGTVEWHEGDLILVGSSRLAAPDTLFLGSTAAKMLRVLAVPMVVVPRRDQPSA
ncbi:universal stress protein [Gordonia sp. LSe1-13]|uniref:Universal stress protein n=1 Tax=Gordonia sesuvii TaxID=3116777 RepID=A0ABU7MK98_9ACTN|nr:universal stress protein [Gordonia sp. LSe1-13]